MTVATKLKPEQIEAMADECEPKFAATNPLEQVCNCLLIATRILMLAAADELRSQS